MDAGWQQHILPQTPAETPPRVDPGGHTDRQPEQVVSGPAVEASASPAAVTPGPALVPGRPTQVVPRAFRVSDGPKPVVPGLVLVPGESPVVPGPAMMPGESPVVSRSVLTPGLPTFRPTWRSVRPGPALLPDGSPSLPLAQWRPQWPELRPGPPLVPRPPPALVTDSQTVVRPTFPELHRGEPLLPADAPGAHQPEPPTEPPAPTAQSLPVAAPTVTARSASLEPPAVIADLQHLRPLLPPDERHRYHPPDVDDYDQQPPPAQLNMAARPPPQQPQPAAPVDNRPRRLPQSTSHSQRSVPGRTAQLAQSSQSPRSSTGYPNQDTQQPAEQREQQPAGQREQQPAGQREQRPAGQRDQQPAGQREQQPAGQWEQQLAGQREQQPAGQRGTVSTDAAEAYPGLQERPGPRLLAQEKTLEAVAEQQPVEGAGLLPPQTLAVLLQRLEERLVASEAQQQQHTTELRAVRHRSVQSIQSQRVSYSLC